jgi:drug/metabolite transporter (DMT)-like permease
LSELFVGEALCLMAAFLWAVSVAMFREPIRVFGAPAINLFKCCLAALLLGLTTLAFGQGERLAEASSRDLSLIVISAVLGLTMGDTALFAAVARIGTHKTLLLQTTAPIFTAVLVAIWQAEIPTPAQGAGAVLILSGIIVVVGSSRATAGNPTATRDTTDTPTAGAALPIAGLALAILAALGQGSGIVFAKEGMRELPVLAASFLRLLVGSLGLILLALPGGGLSRAVRVLRDRSLARVGAASVLGAYLAMLGMMAGVALAPAAVAAVLLATTPIFGLFVDAIALREPVTARGVAGTLTAVAGVAILTTC